MPELYIRTRDTEALAWMQTFAAGITASPATYQLSAAEAAGIQNVVDAFAAACADAVDPQQRTPVNIAIKDEARNAAEQLCRHCLNILPPPPQLIAPLRFRPRPVRLIDVTRT